LSRTQYSNSCGTHVHCMCTQTPRPIIPTLPTTYQLQTSLNTKWDDDS